MHRIKIALLVIVVGFLSTHCVISNEINTYLASLTFSNVISKVYCLIGKSSGFIGNSNTKIIHENEVGGKYNLGKEITEMSERVTLGKNTQIIDGVEKNILTQSMIDSIIRDVDNRKIVIIVKYAFDLNGTRITLPRNCVLKFNGGSIDNGTLTGNFSTYVGKGFGKLLEYKDFVHFSRGVIQVDDLANCDTASNIDSIDNYNLANIINYNIAECIKEYGRARVVFDGNRVYGFKSPIFLLDNTTIDGNGCRIVFPTTSSSLFSMDGSQAFLTNRKHTGLNGDTSHYSTTVLGSKNIIIRNIVFANVKQMKNFGYYVNCERGLIAMYGAEDVLIEGVVADSINTAHCAVWCNNMKNFEVKNCSFTQDPSFDSIGAGGIWTSGSDYMHNVSIHDNRLAFYGDESINIEMKSCAKHNRIIISNNYIRGSLLTTIHNNDKSNPIDYLSYSNNTMEDVTGIISAEHQGNPRLLLMEGDINSIEYRNNTISADTDMALLSFYYPCNVQHVGFIDNVVSGNVWIIDNDDAYVVSCIVKNNKDLVFAFRPNIAVLKKATIVKNNFSINEDISLIGGERGSVIDVKKNVFKSTDGAIKKCIFKSREGDVSIRRNTFISVDIRSLRDDTNGTITMKKNLYQQFF